jgi:CBS domain-containing protein
VTALTELEGLTAADVMHPQLTSLPVTATVGEVRAFFAASSSRRLAVFADEGRYAGSLVPEALAADADPAAAAVQHAAAAPTVRPDAPAAQARDLALEHPSRRLPVVDHAGGLVGIVAIDEQLTRFCGL